MELNSLTNTPGARERRKRVGRGCGSGMGKTSCKGQKGQQSRKGHKHKLVFEGGQMHHRSRLPKRGFNNAAAGAGYGIIRDEQYLTSGNVPNTGAGSGGLATGWKETACYHNPAR